NVAHRVVLHVTHVDLARGVGQHLQHVGLGPFRQIGAFPVTGDGRRPEGVALGPDALPLGLDGCCVVPFRGRDRGLRQGESSISAAFEAPLVTTLRPPATIEPADTTRHFNGIVRLYRAHGWTHASDPERLRVAVERSSLSLVALDDERVVGFARALSDEAFAVYIADVLVSPERQ